jgi:TrmH family RNA methyltransferase
MPFAEPISSTQNPRFRAALALREARDRRRTGRILIDGRREIERALAAGVRPVEAFVDPDRLGESWLTGQADRLERDGVDLVGVSARLLERLSYGDRDTGLVLVAEAPSRTLDELKLPDLPLIGVIEGVEKPGNLGAMLRTADGVGLSALLVADAGTDLFNPNVIRASLGTVFSVPIAVGTAAAVRAWLRDRAIRIVAARVDAVHDHTESDLTGPVAIALGSEAQGLSPVWSGSDVTDVHIPMLGVVDSLNVSATAAILFYEALRQRRGAVAADAEPTAGEGPLRPPGRRPGRT